MMMAFFVVFFITRTTRKKPTIDRSIDRRDITAIIHQNINNREWGFKNHKKMKNEMDVATVLDQFEIFIG